MFYSSACLLCGEVPTTFLIWFLHFTVISMSPLLLKDGLTLQQVATLTLFLVLSFHQTNDKKTQTSLERLITIPVS